MNAVLGHERGEPSPGRRKVSESGECACYVLMSVAVMASFAAMPVYAQNATWLWLPNPASGDFHSPANWTPATVPTGTAFFGPSDTTALTFSDLPATLGGWTFNVGAGAYTFTKNVSGHPLQFDGAGIVVNGGSATIINNRGPLQFRNASTAGNATIANASVLIFAAASTAGNATITNSATVR